MFRYTNFGKDKILHFAVGLLIAYFAALFGVPAFFCGLASLVGGILKEVYDLVKKKTYIDLADILYTTAGSIPVILVTYG